MFESFADSGLALLGVRGWWCGFLRFLRFHEKAQT